MQQRPREIFKGRRDPLGFSAALMSDTKWRKLFVALDRPALNVKQARLKVVDAEKIHVVRVPTRTALHPPKPYIDTDEFGPISLRTIEWIEFPAIVEHSRQPSDGGGFVPSRFVNQDIEQAEAILARVGRFPIRRYGDALRIIGHAR